MFHKLSIQINGVAPLIQHNGRLADPLDPFTRELKRLAAKRKKTDEDAAVLAHVEWCGGLYHTDGTIEIADGSVHFSDDMRVIIPSDMIKKCVVEGARKSKLGKQAQAGVLVSSDAQLRYKGPSNLNELAQNSRFVLRKPVVVNRARVMRTRPIFRSWSCDIALEYDSETLNEEHVLQSMIDAGRYVGIGTWRPENGRFEVQT